MIKENFWVRVKTTKHDVFLSPESDQRNSSFSASRTYVPDFATATTAATAAAAIKGIIIRFVFFKVLHLDFGVGVGGVSFNVRDTFIRIKMICLLLCQWVCCQNYCLIRIIFNSFNMDSKRRLTTWVKSIQSGNVWQLGNPYPTIMSPLPQKILWMVDYCCEASIITPPISSNIVQPICTAMHILWYIAMRRILTSYQSPVFFFCSICKKKPDTCAWNLPKQNDPTSWLGRCRQY